MGLSELYGSIDKNVFGGYLPGGAARPGRGVPTPKAPTPSASTPNPAQQASVITPQARRWLRAISASEGTLRDGQIQYDIMFGGGRFGDLSRHPDKVVRGGGYSSAAAGAYQFMPGTWSEISRKLGLRDFGPQSQDLAAIELIRRRGVDPNTAPINAANVAKLAPEWASLPTLQGKSYYGQPVKPLSFVQQAAAGKINNYTAANATNVDGNAEQETAQAPSDNNKKRLNELEALATLSVLGNLLNAFKPEAPSTSFESGRSLVPPLPKENGELDIAKERLEQERAALAREQEAVRAQQQGERNFMNQQAFLTSLIGQAMESFKPGKPV